LWLVKNRTLTLLLSLCSCLLLTMLLAMFQMLCWVVKSIRAMFLLLLLIIKSKQDLYSSKLHILPWPESDFMWSKNQTLVAHSCNHLANVRKWVKTEPEMNFLSRTWTWILFIEGHVHNSQFMSIKMLFKP